MSFWSDITGGTAAKAAKKAGRVQAEAADEQKAAAQAFETASLGDINTTLPQVTGAISAGEAEALRYRAQAGEALTDAEQQALAQYNASEQQALQRLDQGQAGALGETDRGLGAIDQSTSEALGYFSPYAEAGNGAIKEISDLQGLNGPEAQAAARSRFQTDPGYQFRVSEGLKAIEGSATARGGLYSGAAMKELQERGDQLGAQEYGNYFNRTAGIADLGAQTAGQMANIQTQAGRDKANIYGSRANIYQGTADNAAGIIGQGGANRANLINTAGVNRANVLTGSGDVVQNARTNIANALIGGSQQRVGVRGTALEGVSNALIGKGNAIAGGIVGAANAKTAGASNLLSAGTSLLGAGLSYLKPAPVTNFNFRY